MALEREQWCPACESDREFYRTASTMLHLGEKVKWVCGSCDYVVVRIGDDIESAPSRQ